MCIDKCNADKSTTVSPDFCHYRVIFTRLFHEFHQKPLKNPCRVDIIFTKCLEIWDEKKEDDQRRILTIAKRSRCSSIAWRVSDKSVGRTPRRRGREGPAVWQTRFSCTTSSLARGRRRRRSISGDPFGRVLHRPRDPHDDTSSLKLPRNSDDNTWRRRTAISQLYCNDDGRESAAFINRRRESTTLRPTPHTPSAAGKPVKQTRTWCTELCPGKGTRSGEGRRRFFPTRVTSPHPLLKTNQPTQRSSTRPLLLLLLPSHILFGTFPPQTEYRVDIIALRVEITTFLLISWKQSWERTPI